MDVFHQVFTVSKNILMRVKVCLCVRPSGWFERKAAEGSILTSLNNQLRDKHKKISDLLVVEPLRGRGGVEPPEALRKKYFHQRKKRNTKNKRKKYEPLRESAKKWPGQ